MSELFKHWQQWRQRASERNPFLIEGLLHSAATIMSGRAMAGKSNLAAAMVGAVASGSEEFLGRSVHAHSSVMIACTDGGEANAWGKRMQHHDLAHPVIISQHSRTGQRDSNLGEVVEWAEAQGVN